MHADKLEYGWWEHKRGNVQLPTTLGHPKNFVLTEEELCHFDIELEQLARETEKLRARVASTLRTRRRGRTNYMDEEPTCFTIAHILEFMITHGKAKLGIMNLLVYVAQKRKPDEPTVPGTGSADEGPSGADTR